MRQQKVQRFFFRVKTKRPNLLRFLQSFLSPAEEDCFLLISSLLNVAVLRRNPSGSYNLN